MCLNVQKLHVLNQRINGGMIHCLHMYIDFSQFIPDFLDEIKSFLQEELTKIRACYLLKKIIKQTVEDTFPFKEKLLKENIEYN